MASGGVNANINIAVKNLQALDRLNKNLEASAKAQEKLVKGLDRVSASLTKINAQGNAFGKIAKDASGATGAIGKLSNTLSKVSRLTGGQGGAAKNILGGGMLLGGVGAVGVNKLGAAFDFFKGKLGATIAPATGVTAAIANLGGAISAHPQLWGAAAVAMMMFGDKILPAIGRTSVAAVKGIGKLGQAISKTSKDFALAKATAIDFNIGIINVKKQMENMVRGASLNEIRTLVNQSKNEMESFWSMTRGAEQAAIKLATAIKAQKKEQKALNSLMQRVNVRLGIPHEENLKALQKFKAETIESNRLALAQQKANALERTKQAKHLLLVRRIKNRERAAQRRADKAAEASRAKQARMQARGRMGENLMLGAGFPMLFGGGVGAVGGGILGAGIQGMMGGKGFGAQILLSAIGQQVDAFVSKTAEVGQALISTEQNAQALVDVLGVAGTDFEKNIKQLEKLGATEEAFALARDKMISVVGNKGVEAMEEFGRDTQNLNNEWSKLILQIQAGLAELINSAGMFKALAESIEGITLLSQANLNEGNDPELTRINNQRKERARLGAFRANRQGLPSFQDLDQQAKERQRKLNIEKAIAEQERIQRAIQKAQLDGYVKEIQFLEQNMDLTAKEFEIEVKIRELKEKGKLLDEDAVRDNLKKIQTLEAERETVLEIQEAWKGINQSIRNDVTQGIKGLIKGTATWADMLNNIADKFLDMAINQAFYGNIMGEMGKGSGGLFKFFGFANGGRPPVGKPSIVGEKGPELFVPSSSGRIVPNHELGKGGGSTSVVVNVDASGTEVQGDDAQAKQLGTMLSAAVQAELVKQKRPGGLLAGV